MSESGSGSGDDDMDGSHSLMAAALAMGLIGLLISLLLFAVVIVIFYCLIKTREELKKLQTGPSPASLAENGTSLTLTKEQQTVQKENEIVLDQVEASNPLFSQPSSSNSLSSHTPFSKPTPFTSSKPPIPTKPLRSNPPIHDFAGPGYEDVEPQDPMGPRRATNYDSMTETLLPKELRTVENLEGEGLTEEQVEALKEEERRREQSYEDVESRERRGEEVVEAARMVAKTHGTQGGRKGGGERDTYYDPADALAEQGISIPGSVPSGGHSDHQKRFKMSSSQASDGTPGSYSDVFDSLPPGEKKVIGQKKTERAASDSSPLLSSNSQRRKFPPDAAGYEDVSEDVFSGAGGAADGLSSSVGHLHHPMEGPPGVVGRGRGRVGVGVDDPSKRYSLPHANRRDAAKEMVEINPTSRKPVTLSSQRKKHGFKIGGELAGTEERDGEEEEEEEVEVEGVDAGGDERKSPSETSPEKNKSFSISDDSCGGPQDSYAMVDLAGKKRYRAESDSMKKEGSGAPSNHYTVKDRPPEEGEEGTHM